MFLGGINPLDHNTKEGEEKLIYSFTQCLEWKLGCREQHFGNYCKHLKIPK